MIDFKEAAKSISEEEKAMMPDMPRLASMEPTFDTLKSSAGYSSVRYSPGKYFYEGNPISWGLKIQCTGIEEVKIALKSCPEEQMVSPQEANNSLTRGVYISAGGGTNLYHGDPIDSVRRFYMTEEQMLESEKPAMLLARPKKRRKVSTPAGANLEVFIQPCLIIDPDLSQLNISPDWASTSIEYLGDGKVKMYCSVNDIKPNYTDLVVEVKVTPHESAEFKLF